MQAGQFNAAEYVGLFVELFKQSSDAVFLSRARDGMVLDANDAFFSLFGLDRDRVVGHTSMELGIWLSAGEREEALRPADDREGVRSTIVRVRNAWSEEFRVRLAAVRLPLRGEDTILGVVTPLSRIPSAAT